ncbi:hypothetical protein [Moorena producens]|uniref:hypothetical protein n=1 Tax=Moorena producens TaxID=1155739 RepID=UPI003C7347BC
MGRWGDGEIFIKRCSAVLGRQRGLGGLPHERLPWFPPLAIASRQGNYPDMI